MLEAPVSTEILSVAIVTETFPPEVNGVSRTLSALTDELAARGHRIDVVRPQQEPGDRPDLSGPVRQFLVDGRSLPGLGSLRFPVHGGLRAGRLCTRALKRQWSRTRPDLVHIATEGPLGYSALTAAKSLDLPVAIGFHTDFDAYAPYYRLGSLRPAIRRYLKWFHNRADLTLAPTRMLRNRLAAEGYRTVSVLGRGVDTKNFSPDRRSDALREAWGAGDHTRVAMFVGRVAPEKNCALAIAAFRRIASRTPNSRMVVVGDGPQMHELRLQHRDVVFAGERSGPDLAAHYASADLFLFPSLVDTFGSVVTEAMASGLAPVAFDYAAAHEHIKNDVSGVLVPFGRGRDFTESAAALAEDRARTRRLRREARVVAEDLSWRRSALRLEEIYRHLAAPTGADASDRSRLHGRTVLAPRQA